MEETTLLEGNDQQEQQQDPPKKMKVSEFAVKLKQKYPEYKDIDDSELVNKVVQKYPEYKEMVDLTEVQPSKKKVGSVDFSKSSLTASVPPSTDQNDNTEIPTVGLDKENVPEATDPISRSLKALELSKETKSFSNPNGMAMGTSSTEVPNDESINISENIKKDLKKEGYDADELANDFKDYPKEAFDMDNTSRETMLALKKDNPIKYAERLNDTKTVYNIAKNSDIATANQFNHLNGAGEGEFGSMNEFIAAKQAQQQIIDRTLSGKERDIAQQRLARTSAKFINPLVPDLVEEYQNSPIKDNVDVTQYAGLKTLEIFQPERYKRDIAILSAPQENNYVVNLKGDISYTTKDKKQAEQLGGQLTPVSIDQQIGREKIMRELTDIGRTNTAELLKRKQYDLDKAFASATDEGQKEQIRNEYLDAQSKLMALDEDAKKDDLKYPLTAKLKLDNHLKDLAQGTDMGLLSYAGNRIGKSFQNTTDTWEDIMTGLLGSEKDNANLQAGRLGQVEQFNSKMYLPKNLSSSENLLSKATMYKIAGFTGDVLGFMAQTAAGGGNRAAEMATLFGTTYSEAYNQASEEGMSSRMAHKYGLVHGGVMMLAGLFGSKYEAVKNILKDAKSPLSKEIEGMGEQAWNNIVNKNKGTITRVAKAAGEVGKEQAKMIGTFGVGATIASDLADKGFFNKKVSTDEMIDHAVNSAKDMAIGGLLLSGLGFVNKLRSNGVTPMDKMNLWENGDHPDVGKARVDEMVTSGDITPIGGEKRKKAIDNVASIIQRIPQVDAKGKPMSAKMKVDYLYNEAIKLKASEAESEMPSKKEDAQKEKMVAEFGNKIIFEQPTVKELEKRNSQIDKELEPEKDESGKVIPIDEKKELELKAEKEAIEKSIKEKTAEEPKEIEVKAQPIEITEETKPNNETKDNGGITEESSSAIQPNKEISTGQDNKGEAQDGSKGTGRNGEGGETGNVGGGNNGGNAGAVAGESEGSGSKGSILTKSELSKYETAKSLFDKEKNTTWNDIVDGAVTKLIKDNPNISVEKAAAEHVDRLARMYDENKSYNPTAEDLAIISLHKLDVKNKIDEIKKWDSDDADERVDALSELQPLYEQMQKIAKAANPREAGTAFGIRQMLVSMGADGLKIMRMQLMKDKGGEKLSEDDLKFTAEQFAKEKELMEEKHELEKQQMNEKFDKSIKEWESKYNDLLNEKSDVEKSSKKAKTRQEKLQQKGKDIADKLRKGRIDGAKSDPFLVGVAFNKVIGIVADLVEKGATLAAAIDKYVTDNKLESKRKQIEDAIIDHLDRGDLRDKAVEKLNELKETSGATTITIEMTDAGAVKDFIHSYVNEVELNQVSDVAFKKLKEILPDITKEQFKRAYLKEGEFKSTTSADIKNMSANEKRNYNNLTKLETELGELNRTRDIKIKNKKETTKVDERIQKVRDAINKELISQGRKKASSPEYKKKAEQKIADYHDSNIDGFANMFESIAGKLKDEVRKPIESVINSLKEKKINYEPDSKLSQSRKVDTALDGIDIVQKQLEDVKGKIDKDTYHEMQLHLQNIKDAYEKVKDENMQDVMVEEAKRNAESKIKEYQRKIAAKEFDDAPQKRILTKHDTELVKKNIELNAIKSVFDTRAEKYRKENRSGAMVVVDMLRSIGVNALIGMPKTFLKLVVASPAKIATTWLSKVTVGQLSNVIFNKGLLSAAKEGGESSSIQSANRGLEIVFSHKGEKEIEQAANKNTENYNKAVDDFENDKTEKNKAKMQKALIRSASTTMFQFVGGKTLKTMWDKLWHRNTIYERQNGEFTREEWSKVSNWRHVADNIEYIFSMVGRSHGALKSISGRYHYATEFMAKLESAMEKGEDISDFNTLQRISVESYAGWESGMYQQDNWVSDKTNKWVNDLKETDNRFAQGLGHLLSWDVAIRKVPVNMMNEAIMELALGVPIALGKYSKAYMDARSIVKTAMPEIKTKEQKAEFQRMLSEELSHLDKKQAALILRSFRHGGLGLGVLALTSLLASTQFGGWHHKGEKNDDRKKKPNEPKAGEIVVNNEKLNEYLSACLEHTNAIYPFLAFKSMSNNWNNGKKKELTNVENSANMVYSELENIVNSYPPTKVVNPLSIGKEAAKQYWDASARALESYAGVEKKVGGFGGAGASSEVMKFVKDNYITIGKPSNLDKLKNYKVDKNGKPLNRAEREKYEALRKTKIEDGIIDLVKKGRYVWDEKADRPVMKKGSEMTREQLKWVKQKISKQASDDAEKELFGEPDAEIKAVNSAEKSARERQIEELENKMRN